MHNEFVKENSKSATAKTSKAGVPRVEGSGPEHLVENKRDRFSKE